ncbi:MAG: methyltransferase domain-containing protein [Longimicrobiales bacterium]
MDDATDKRTLERTLRDLAVINRWLGGVRAIQSAVRPWFLPDANVSLLDAGCGGGDIAEALIQFANRTRTLLTVAAIDRNATTAAIAHGRTRDAGRIHVACATTFALPFPDRTFDIVLMSLTLHHFNESGCAHAVREMARVAKDLVIVHELERSWAHYLGARLLAATLWRRSPFTRHDGPVSVLRAFTPPELERALVADALAPATVRRRFFYRLIGTAERTALSV